LARRFPRYGYRRIHAMLVRRGWTVHLKRVRRLWIELGLKRPVRLRKLRKLGPKPGASVQSCIEQPARFKNDVWTCDSHGKSENRWSFTNANGKDRETLTFQPCFSMNDYAGLASALRAGAGIGELPPLVRPELLRNGRLVEVMPKWRFRTVKLSVAHRVNRYIPRSVRMFKKFAAEMAPTLFPELPT
jgi:transposase InsO family protein